MPDLPSHQEIHIRARCGGRDVKLFWISLKSNGNISVGSAGRSTQVVRRRKLEGKEGVDELIQDPHVTFHRPHWTHLTNNRGPAIWEALTWGAPAPGNPPQSWIELITSPIGSLPIGGRRYGQEVEPWLLECDDDSKSAILFVDFANMSHVAANKSKQDRFVIWGETVLRFRFAVLDGQSPALQVYTWG
jgi:hypothetical protein